MGKSQGYSRHRADFYVPNDRPKRLWLKALHPEACERLTAARLPEDQARDQTAPPSGVLPLKHGQLRSLMEALQRAPDPGRVTAGFGLGRFFRSS